MQTPRVTKACLALLVALFIAALPSMNPLATAAPADQPAKVFLNGQPLAFDVPPAVEGGRTLVPVRAIFEALGAKVEWDGPTRTAVAVKDGLVVRLQADNLEGEVNGQKSKMDVPT